MAIHHPSCPARDPEVPRDLCRCVAGEEPETAEGPAYEWRCFGTVVCDQMLDRHGRECDRLNDEARTEFYEALVEEETATPEARRRGMHLVETVWADEVVR